MSCTSDIDDKAFDNLKAFLHALIHCLGAGPRDKHIITHTDIRHTFIHGICDSLAKEDHTRSFIS